MLFLGKKLGKNEYPFIVAEISCNHEGNIDQAKALIEAAKIAGADAVKIQVYNPIDMTIDINKEDFKINKGPWEGNTLYELYTKTKTDYDMASYLLDNAKKIGIDCFASVFGRQSLSWLEANECPAYKIASFELTHTFLIRKVAKTGKPVVLSTGTANLSEIDVAMQCVNPENCVLLHCVSAYPTKLEQANLWRIPYLANLFPCPIGYSDHTRGIIAGPLACAMGARMIEKHLALPQTNPEDAAFSLHPDEFKTYVRDCRKAAEAAFQVEVPEEKNSRQFRRSLYVVKDVKAGDAFTMDNLRAIRPGYGMPASLFTKMLYTRARQDIKAGTALKEEMVE